jgi:N6-adenosine-specific RNA methylase IME4
MPLEDILKIKPPAAADCALWFWTTNAFLADGTAAEVVKAWGFEPKTVYTWRKVDKNGNDRLGAGRYGRNVTEHAILAVRGKPVIDAADQPNIFDAPRTSRHSQKPDRFFEIVEKVTPCAPAARIELFAIDERKGWNTSGSEQQAKARAKRPDAREPILETKTGEGASLIWREGSGDVLRAGGASGIAYSIKPSSKAPGFVELADTDSNAVHLPNRLLAKERADEWERAALAEAAEKAADAEAFGRGAPRKVGSHAPERAKRIAEANRAKQRKALKTKTPGVSYTCSFCDLVTEKWSGKCPGCGNWGTLNETGAATTKPKRAKSKPELKQRAKTAPATYRKLEWHPRRPNSEIVAVAKGRSGRRYVIKRGGTKADPHFDMIYEALQGSRLGAGPGGHHLLDSIDKAKASADRHERRELGLDS